jgi:diacylglycerol kinase family enzyme
MDAQHSRRAAVKPSERAAARVPVRVVVNANASGALSAPGRNELVRALRDAGADADAELERTHDLQELAAVWRHDDGRRLILVGGDGSVHAVANLAGPARAVA